jgi:hypothetical protein
MVLEYETVVKVYQKDVNNYLTVDAKGKVKSKGAWAKTWLRKDEHKNLVNDYTEYDCVILRKALHAYYQHGTPVRETIEEATDLIDFQKIVMVSRKYSHAFHGRPEEVKYKESYSGKTLKKLQANDTCIELKERHLRVFASTNTDHGGIYKVHAVKKNINKVSDTPTHAFIINDDITGIKLDNTLGCITKYPLDREYYIKMAEDRVKKFINREDHQSA